MVKIKFKMAKLILKIKYKDKAYTVSTFKKKIEYEILQYIQTY